MKKADLLKKLNDLPEKPGHTDVWPEFFLAQPQPFTDRLVLRAATDAVPRRHRAGVLRFADSGNQLPAPPAGQRFCELYVFSAS